MLYFCFWSRSSSAFLTCSSKKRLLASEFKRLSQISSSVVKGDWSVMGLLGWCNSFANGKNGINLIRWEGFIPASKGRSCYFIGWLSNKPLRQNFLLGLIGGMAFNRSWCRRWDMWKHRFSLSVAFTITVLVPTSSLCAPHHEKQQKDRKNALQASCLYAASSSWR